MLCRTLVLLAVAAGMLTVATRSEAEEVAKDEGATGSKSWIFDQGLYTNNRKTGERVWQYTSPKPAYRDPDAIFDSPHGAYPFQPDAYDPYSVYYPSVYGMLGYPYAYPSPVYGLVPPIVLPTRNAP